MERSTLNPACITMARWLMLCRFGTFHLPSVIAVGVAFVTKASLFLYCWALRNKYSQIRILWEDHRNDLFINGFGLLTSVGGSKLR